MQTQTQQLKTITVKTSTKQESVHMETLYAIIENCYNSLQIMEADCTSASYFINSANIFAQLQMLYCDNETNDYVSIESVMEVFSKNITNAMDVMDRADDQVSGMVNALGDIFGSIF